jgi:hypothetical protein
MLQHILCSPCRFKHQHDLQHHHKQPLSPGPSPKPNKEASESLAAAGWTGRSNSKTPPGEAKRTLSDVGWANRGEGEGETKEDAGEGSLAADMSAGDGVGVGVVVRADVSASADGAAGEGGVGREGSGGEGARGEGAYTIGSNGSVGGNALDAGPSGAMGRGDPGSTGTREREQFGELPSYCFTLGGVATIDCSPSSVDPPPPSKTSVLPPQASYAKLDRVTCAERISGFCFGVIIAGLVAALCVRIAPGNAPLRRLSQRSQIHRKRRLARNRTLLPHPKSASVMPALRCARWSLGCLRPFNFPGCQYASQRKFLSLRSRCALRKHIYPFQRRDFLPPVAAIHVSCPFLSPRHSIQKCSNLLVLQPQAHTGDRRTSTTTTTTD